MKKLVLLVAFIIGMKQSFSQWNNNPTVNNLVANSLQNETDPICITDGANGSIIIFNIGDDIYAQKITSAGTIAWGGTSSPVMICNAAEGQYLDGAIADGAGGAYIAWEDYRHDPDFGEIYIQHINSNGTATWPANGTRVTNTSDNDDYDCFVCSDGSGGIIVAWSWDNYEDNTQLSAQRYNSAGVAQWVANGVQISTAPGFRAGSSIVTDGASGAILFFVDTRDDPHGTDYDYLSDNVLTNINIYAQRVNGSGALMWSNNGVVVCNAPGNQYNYGNGDNNTTVTDGSGGAIALFDDERNSTTDTDGFPVNSDIYAQKINANGIPQWTANGIPLTTAPGNQFTESVVSDGAGGFVAAWDDNDAGVELTQKINATGAASWTVNGQMIVSSGTYASRIVADGAGNYIYCFFNYDAGVPALYTQKIDAAGALKWGANGAQVCINSAGVIDNLPAIVLSDNGGAIMSWADERNFATTGSDIFASKVLSNGSLAISSDTGFVSIANGNWNNPAIWKAGVVPPATAQVKVKHNVTVTADASCDSLHLELPGAVMVKTGINLTVSHIPALIVTHGTWTAITDSGDIVLNFYKDGTGLFYDYIHTGLPNQVTWEYISAESIIRVKTRDIWFYWKENDVIDYKIISLTKDELELNDVASPDPWQYQFN